MSSSGVQKQFKPHVAIIRTFNESQGHGRAIAPNGGPNDPGSALIEFVFRMKHRRKVVLRNGKPAITDTVDAYRTKIDRLGSGIFAIVELDKNLGRYNAVRWGYLPNAYMKAYLAQLAALAEEAAQESTNVSYGTVAPSEA